jgi:multidrug efflux system membrane fusion protein
VLSGQDSSYVYVVDAKNVAQPRNVTPGMDVAGMTVIEKGLRDGEQVVVDGQSRLNPGAHVMIIRPGADTAGSRQLVRAKGYGATAAGDVNHASQRGGATP